MLNGENDLDKIGNYKFNYNKARVEFTSLTGLEITNECLDYMRAKLPSFTDEILMNATAKDMMLEEYDNYMMSNKTVDKLKYEKYMEEMANKEYPDFNEDDTNFYCKYKNVYFEWNKIHMLEHIERHNTLGEVAKLVVDNTESIKVDTRKNYGEVRYILTCKDEKGKRIVVTCYRYDKTHIRIITAWEEC